MVFGVWIRLGELLGCGGMKWLQEPGPERLASGNGKKGEDLDEENRTCKPIHYKMDVHELKFCVRVILDAPIHNILGFLPWLGLFSTISRNALLNGI